MSGITFKKNSQDVVGLNLTPADFDADGLWHSDDVATSTNDTRFTANVTFTALDPDGADNNVDYRLQAILEGQEDNGDWLPLVGQFTPTFSSENANTRRLIISDKPSAYSPDVNYILTDALGREAVEVTFADVEVPSKIRLCVANLSRNSTGALPLVGFTLTATGQVS